MAIPVLASTTSWGDSNLTERRLALVGPQGVWCHPPMCPRWACSGAMAAASLGQITQRPLQRNLAMTKWVGQAGGTPWSGNGLRRR